MAVVVWLQRRRKVSLPSLEYNWWWGLDRITKLSWLLLTWLCWWTEEHVFSSHERVWDGEPRALLSNISHIWYALLGTRKDNMITISFGNYIIIGLQYPSVRCLIVVQVNSMTPCQSSPGVKLHGSQAGLEFRHFRGKAIWPSRSHFFEGHKGHMTEHKGCWVKVRWFYLSD